MHVARIFATATLLQNGKVLIAGGSNTIGSLGVDIYASAELYDPATGKFTKTGSMTVARAHHTATLLADGSVLIAGGADCTDTACIASAELYHPTTGKFTRTGSMSTPRGNPISTLLPDGRVLLAQGTSGANQSAELYDPKSGQFVRTGKETGFDDPTLTLLPNGKVLETGGTGSGGIGAEVYDGTTGKFTKVSLDLAACVTPSAQYKGQVVKREWPEPVTVLKSGRVLLFEGGYLETYDPATGTCADAGFISPAADWLRPRGAMLNDGRVLFVGGELNVDPATYNYVSTASAVLYDPAGGPQMTGSMKTARDYSTVTLLPDGSVLIAGGADSDFKPLASAELFKP
jgi:WD40 repeat protein